MENKRLRKGLIAATFTPFTKKGDVNINLIGSYAKHIINSGIIGVFVNGTTGEFTSLTTTERKLLLEEWVKEANGKFKVVAHVGSNCQKESIELAEHASSIGADAIASICPGFFKPESVKELVRFFKPIANSSELPFYYYHMPTMNGVYLSMIDFLERAESEITSLAGIKFTHNNFMEMAQCINLSNNKFEILNGYDEMLLCGLSVGATSAVGSTYNYSADIYIELINEMEKGNLGQAQLRQLNSTELVNIIIKYGGGVRGGKAIMKLIGVDCGECRPPIRSFLKSEYQSLEKDMRNMSFKINRVN